MTIREGYIVMDLNPEQFEMEVRRIARSLWPDSSGGSTKINGRERDGVFITEEIIHYLEATISRKVDKVKEDAKKLSELYRKRQDNTVVCWLITLYDPSPDQKQVVREFEKKHQFKIRLMSFKQFKSKLIDVMKYFEVRENYAFGSIRNPETGQFQDEVKYIALDIVDIKDEEIRDLDGIKQNIANGHKIVVLGDYGAGKSMTLREVYKKLKKDYISGNLYKFPVYINLRDHQGQTNPSEIFMRHADNIGFSDHSHLVRAWRAGLSILILDGFDEIGAYGITGSWKKLKDIRYRSMTAIRNLIDQTPPEAGVILAGRAHYFDNDKERRSALSINDTFSELSLNDFTDDQIEQFVESNHYTGAVPTWLPSRPLLIGYLLSRGFLTKKIEEKDPAIGWNRLLIMVCEREAKIEKGIDSETVRRIIEKLATKSRAAQDGLGAISDDDIIVAYKHISGGLAPDDNALVILQRLPGLGISSSNGGRSFLDLDFVDACSAGDLSRFILDPYNSDNDWLPETQCGLRALGIGISSLKLDESKCTSKQIEASLGFADKNLNSKTMCSDIVRIAVEKNLSLTDTIIIEGVIIPYFEFEGTSNYDVVQFRECNIQRLRIDPNSDKNKFPSFKECYFELIEGATSEKELPEGQFIDCLYNLFSEGTDTTSDIQRLPVARGRKVCLSILDKIFLQRGAGRIESALYRGLDPECGRLVQDVINILRSEELITNYQRRGAKIWRPNRKQMIRVHKMLSAPIASRDKALIRCDSIG